MIPKQIGWTFALEVFYVVAAVSCDYLLNIVIGHSPQSFTPFVTAGITLVVGAPVTYYLTSQHFKLKRVLAERESLQRDLEAAVGSAEAGANAKADFLANMTHELRTPLNAIVGFSGVLTTSKDLTPRDARHVALIQGASHTLLDLVNSVLDFSRLDAGGVELDVKPFDPAAPVRDAIELLSPKAKANGLSLMVQTEGDLIPLLGDVGRIHQVMLNFLSNALKFTAVGGVDVVVRQRPDGPRHSVLNISVRDTGMGVDEDQLVHLFDRFTQADATVSRRFGGTGLGLAICKQSIELMGGVIGCESKLGFGSTFWFEVRLPIAESMALDCDENEPSPLDRPLSVLLVEDLAVNRELVATLLAPFDVVLEMAENGRLAVEAVSRRHFDLVLMDVQMPVMDGLCATRAIRELPGAAGQSTPIIAMTANVLPEQVRTCLEAGMDDHIGKPVRPAELLERLSRWSAGREARAVAAEVQQAS